MATPRSVWHLTRDRWPTEASFRRGVVIAALGSNGKWWLKDMQMEGVGMFTTVNFGSTPQYWTYVDLIAPVASPSYIRSCQK